MAWFYTIYIYRNPIRDELLAWKHFSDDNSLIRDENRTPEDYLHKSGTTGTTVVTKQLSDWLSGSFARVNVYFEDTTIFLQKQCPAYRWNDLLADIGGVLGLWVGVSVVTIFEFLVLVSELVLLPCRRNRTTKDKQSSQH